MKKLKEERIILDNSGKEKKKFVKSMDLEWFIAVAKLKGKGTLVVAVGLYFWCSIFKKGFNKPFNLSISRLGREFGLHESTTYRGFKRLENANYVSAKRNSGKKHTIILHDKPTVLPTPSVDDSTSPNNMLFENLDDGEVVNHRGIDGEL